MNRVDASTLLFFDASCLIAAVASPTGGAGFIWGLCERGFLQAAVSHSVLTEVATNLAGKFDPRYLDLLDQRLRACAPSIAPVPRLDERARTYPEINPKDQHVVAAPLAVHADRILTLDRPLAQEIERSGLGILARSPGEFIQRDLISHPFYSHLRQE